MTESLPQQKKARHLFEELVAFRREALASRAQLLRPGYHDDHDLELVESSAATLARLTCRAGELAALVAPLTNTSMTDLSGVESCLKTLSESPVALFSISAADLDRRLIVCTEAIAKIFLIEEGALLPFDKEADGI